MLTDAAILIYTMIVHLLLRWP